MLQRSPSFAANQEAGVREMLEAEDGPRADEMLKLGLAVVPGHLGLLSLREAVAAAPARAPRPAAAAVADEDEPQDEDDDEIEDYDEDADEDALDLDDDDDE